MARKRELTNAAAPIAAATVPPVLTIEIAANCAEPANTSADMAIACSSVIPACTASTPNETERIPPAAANGTPSRTPRRKEGRRSRITGRARCASAHAGRLRSLAADEGEDR
jgi:hypothetical protein